MPGRQDSDAITCHIVEEMFVRKPPAVLSGVVADPATWRQWWPDLQLTMTRDRGVEGMHWRVDGAVQGEMEIWLEPACGGTVVHWFVRGQGTGRGLERWRRRAVLAWRAHLFDLKDRLEAVKSPARPADQT